MRTFFLLLRVQIHALSNSLVPAARKGRALEHRASRIVFTGLGYALLGGILAAYMALTGIGLAKVGLGQAIPSLAVLMGSLAGVVFTFMKANGTLFGLTDFDLVMSLPIPRRVVVASRIAALFGSATLLGAVLMLPLWIVYLLLVESSAWAVFCAAVSILLAPAVPTSLATFVAFGATALASRFRHANLAYVLIGTVGITALVIACYAFSFQAGATTDKEQALSMMTDTLAATSAAVASVWPPAAWLADAATTGAVLPLLAFVALSAAVPALTLEILQRFYLDINGALNARSARTAMSGEQLRRSAGRRRTPFWSMVAKEYRALIGIPSYAFNCLFGYLLMIAIAMALAVLGLDSILASGAGDGAELDAAAYALFNGIMGGVLPWLFVFLAVICPSAACSVSMEGRSAWIMATAPVPAHTVLGAKLASNALPVAGTLTASAIMLAVSGQVDALGAVQIACTGMGVFYLVINVALAADAARPNFDWSSPNEIVKRGVPIMVAIIGGMVVAFAGGAASVAIALNGELWMSAAFNIAVGVAGLVGGQLLFMRTCKRTDFMLG